MPSCFSAWYPSMWPISSATMRFVMVSASVYHRTVSRKSSISMRLLSSFFSSSRHQLGAGHRYQRIILPPQRQKIREKLHAGSFDSPMSAISPHENTPQCGGALDSQCGKNFICGTSGRCSAQLRPNRSEATKKERSLG